MSKDQVIAKGKYTHAQPSSVIGVKQYIFVRGEDGKKRLLLRFNNNRSEKCSKFAFILCRLDTKGNVLGEERYESADRVYLEKEVFSFDQKIEVEERCTDFVVKLVYARYGSYTHLVENNEVSVVYDEKKVPSSRKKGNAKAKPRKISGRSFDMPWAFAIISLLILAIAFAATGFLLRDFMDTKKDFSLSGVHYKFADKDKKEIIVVGCSDNYREIELLSTVDGEYKVVGIEKGAFKSNKNLRKITISGINVDAEAFMGCAKLESIIINDVTSIGEKAFYDCRSLKSVVINDGKKGQLLTIDSRAFGDCKELKTVEINQTLIYGEKTDYFHNSNNIEVLKLRNLAYTMKDVQSNYVTRLNALFGNDSVSSTHSKLKTLEIGNIDNIPANFAYGFTKLESVTIKNGEITRVGENAFRDCASLTSLNAKLKLEDIGRYAFSGTSIASIDLSNVKALGSNAFKGAKRLSSVNGLGAGGIDHIPQSAFEGCKSLTSFTIHENIKHIYKEAFKGSGLTSFTLPQGVACGAGILADCSSIKELRLYELGTAGFVGYYFGVTSSSSSSEAMADKIPHSLKTVTLDSGTEINAHAFKGCSTVERINFPEGVVSFGEYAFAGCESLKTVNIPVSTLKSIGDYAFYNTALESIELPTTLNYIGYGALNGCDNLRYLTIPFLGSVPNLSDGTIGHVFAQEVPASLTSISLVPNTQMVSLPAYAFASCTGATTINVPSTVAVIGEGAFYNCNSLVYIDLSKVTSIGNDAFKGCSSLTAVQLCGDIINLGNNAFADSGLVSVDIPASIKTIGNGVFSGCRNLTSISLPYLGATYGSTDDAYVARLFDGMSEEIPSSLISISVTKPFANGIIPSYAFSGCENVTSFGIPSGYTRIEEGAFNGCKKLISFNFDGVSYIGPAAFSGTGIISADFDSSLEEIKALAFQDCQSLASVSLPEGITTIERGAFRNTAITSIELPSSVAYVDDYAFAQTKLKEITFSSNTWYIGYGVLSGCNEIEKLTFPMTGDMDNSYYTVSGYLFEGDFPSTLKSITINASNSGAIYSYAFANAYSVEEIIINANVYEIYSQAFDSCTSLRYVCLPSTVYYVASDAFNGCYRLYEITTGGRWFDIPNVLEFTAVKAPSVTTNGGYTFSCYNGEWYLVDYPNEENIAPDASFTYQGSVVSSYHIPAYLFYDNDTVQSVVLPASVMSLGEKAFMHCDMLSTVKFENNTAVTEIKDETFGFCPSLTEVVLPSSVTSIGSYAFQECTSLTDVVFPISLKLIGDGAFYNCGMLRAVKLYENVEYIGDYAFYQCFNLYDVYNSSALNIKVGEYGYGHVARFAVRVHTDMNEAPSVEVYIAGKGTFRRSGGHWLLINGDDTRSVTLNAFKYEDTTVSSYRIKEGAFSYCYNLEVLSISNAVNQIQASAFLNCTGLKSVEFVGNVSILELEYATFANCYALRSVKLPVTVEVIGESVFYNCYDLSYIEMPDDLREIGAYAFQNCEKLLSVTLNDNVTGIGTDAFYGCEILFEVYDLSPYINVSKGGYDNGMVGYYADTVFTDKSQSLERHEQNGLKFIKTSSYWYLYAFENQGESIVTVPNLGSGLIILEDSMKDGTFTAVVLPTNLREISSGAFNNCYSFTTIYYQGGDDQWDSVVDNSDYGYFKELYYYEKCVHYDSYHGWCYDASGNVTTAVCKEDSKITKESTCYETGVKEYSCACQGCTYTRKETLSKTEHSFVDGVCQICSDILVTVNNEVLTEYGEKGTVEMTDFLYDEASGYIVSQNKENSSKSFFTITAEERMTAVFTIQASSEAYDYIVVYVNGISRGRASGRQSYSFSELLEAGDVLTISYEKDITDSLNDDCGYIKDLKLIVKATTND